MLYYALILLPCFFLYKAAPMSLNLFEAALVHKTREKKKNSKLILTKPYTQLKMYQQPAACTMKMVLANKQTPACKMSTILEKQ